MNNFIFQNPTKIIFGKGTISSIKEEISKEKKILVTFGGGSVKTNGVYDQVVKALIQHNFVEFWGIEANPDISTLRKAIEFGKNEKCDYVLAVGGGSVIDGSKLIAAGIVYDGDAWEIVLKRDWTNQATLPLSSVLTLPATGSEMNSGAVISNREKREKFAFYSKHPVFSILDPETTFTLPKHQIACGLADTFIHVMEQYLTTTNQSPLMDRWAEGILQTIIETAPVALKDQTNYNAMSSFMLSATMALNGFVSMGVTQDWATHMIGHELTALLGLTHGHTLTIVLPGTMWVLKEEKGDKILQYGKRVFGIEGAEREETIKQIIERTEKFFQSLGLKTRLSENGGDSSTIEEITRRFGERGVKYGENRSVTPEVTKQILEWVL